MDEEPAANEDAMDDDDDTEQVWRGPTKSDMQEAMKAFIAGSIAPSVAGARAMRLQAVSNATVKCCTVHGPTNLRPCRFEVSRVASRLPRHTHAAVSQRHGG